MTEDRKFDAYQFDAYDEDSLMDEVDAMECDSEWMPNIPSKELRLEAIEAPIFADMVADKHNLNVELAEDTAYHSQLLIGTGVNVGLVRDTAVPTLLNTAKLYGSALGRMEPPLMAETLNNGLSVAEGKSLMLIRCGKVSAVHSDNEGGYAAMPISELLDATHEKCQKRFGRMRFLRGVNTHGYTGCMWELPDAKERLNKEYRKALDGAVSKFHTIDFMPTLKFVSSDTQISSATLVPCFRKGSAYFSVVDGVKVRHRRGANNPKEVYIDELNGVYARFEDSVKRIAELAQIEIAYPENCLIGLCKKYGLAKKYAEVGRAELAQYAAGLPCVSAHDVYLCLVDAVAEAESAGADMRTVANLEEIIAKMVNADWESFDVGGVVTW